MGKPRAHGKEGRGAGTPHFLPVTAAVQQMAVMGCDTGRWPSTGDPGLGHSGSSSFRLTSTGWAGLDLTKRHQA